MISKSDAQWMFFYQLGRFADKQTVEHYAETANSLSELRNIFYTSAERRAKGLTPQSPGKFMLLRENAKKLLILGNCQGPNLARQIAASTNLSVMGVEVMDYQNNKDLFIEMVESADYVASCLLSPNFEEISTQNLRKRSDIKILFYCPMYFEGIHPDIVYWGGMGQRVSSGAGDYHSRIVLSSYLTGRSERECLHSLNKNTYQNLGYFDDFERSFDEMKRREDNCDIKFRPFLLENIKDRNCFLTVNHPTQYFLSYMSQKICEYFSFDFSHIDFNSIQSTLAYGPQWPIVPEIIERFNLSYSNGNMFQNNGIMMDWEEHIARSYILYNDLGTDKLWGAGNEAQKLILKRGQNG